MTNINRTYKGAEYTVTRYVEHGANIVQLRGRWPDAQLRAKRLAYDALEGVALLDRPVAHRAMNTVDNWVKPAKGGRHDLTAGPVVISITRAL